MLILFFVVVLKEFCHCETFYKKNVFLLCREQLLAPWQAIAAFMMHQVNVNLLT